MTDPASSSATLDSSITSKQKLLSANPSIKTPYNYGAKVGLQGFDTAMGLSSAQIVRFKLSALGGYQMASWLRGDAVLEGQFDSGRAQNTTDDSNSKMGVQPENKFAVREANLTATPLSWTELKAGAISHEDLQSPLLFYRSTFPAARESLIWKSPAHQLAFSLEQAVPTGTTLASQTSEREPMPRLAIESVRGQVKLHKSWELSGFVHRFSFFDLPSAVAQDSRLGGNTVDGDQSARFRYGFQGFAYGSELAYQPEFGVGSLLGGSVVQNQLAPEGRNLGYLGYNEWNFRLNSNLSLAPRYTYFVNQSDSTLAYYNCWWFGHNNTYGQALELSFYFPRSKFRTNLLASQSRAIDDTALQNTGDINHIYLLSVETDYARF